MTLLDARRLAVRKALRIRFALPGGRECVIDPHGVARVPGLDAAPQFNLEEEFSRTGSFILESSTGTTQDASRQELETLAGERAQPAVAED